MDTQQSSEQTKKCSKCGEVIQASAKKCKHCQADLRNWFARHKVLTGLIAIIVLIIIASSGGKKEKSSSTNTASNSGTTKPEEVKYKLNDMIKNDKFEIAVTKIEQRKEVGTKFFHSNPAEGGMYVAVQWKYKNISDKPIGSFSTPRVKLMDANGTSYDPDIEASGNFATEIDPDRKVFSDLNPGISVNDAKVFEVGKDKFDMANWKLEINADSEKYKVELQ